MAALPSATAISTKLPPALAGSVNCRLASSSGVVSAGAPRDQDLGSVREAFALDDEGLAGLGGSVVGDWVAGLVQDHGADHTVAQFRAQGRLGGEREGEDEEQQEPGDTSPSREPSGSGLRHISLRPPGRSVGHGIQLAIPQIELLHFVQAEGPRAAAAEHGELIAALIDRAVAVQSLRERDGLALCLDTSRSAPARARD